ncbi:uncharacterized protein LOC133886906 [Phragmites australis]|uniref:uncharacterized protein LOC133886906 n=1 Tax=Phragmites australis TaxID=29695 RepID=UPI002D790655|nr:uncharacterized protein LOC133886906 [Phragmites australis]
MLMEEENKRIHIVQGLPWTTDEPECLLKPPVKERTEPIDLVLHSDVRAVERVKFDQYCSHPTCVLRITLFVHVLLIFVLSLKMMTKSTSCYLMRMRIHAFGYSCTAKSTDSHLLNAHL